MEMTHLENRGKQKSQLNTLVDFCFNYENQLVIINLITFS